MRACVRVCVCVLDTSTRVCEECEREKKSSEGAVNLPVAANLYSLLTFIITPLYSCDLILSIDAGLCQPHVTDISERSAMMSILLAPSYCITSIVQYKNCWLPAPILCGAMLYGYAGSINTGNRWHERGVEVNGCATCLALKLCIKRQEPQKAETDCSLHRQSH